MDKRNGVGSENLLTQDTTDTPEAKMQSAEYAAILDIIGKIATKKNKTEVIAGIREIFTVIMGSNEFLFHSGKSAIGRLPDGIKRWLKEGKKSSSFLKGEDRFYVALNQDGRRSGVIEAGGFAFPQYIDRYLNFAISISPVLSLVLSNIERYEMLERNRAERDRLYVALDAEMRNAKEAHKRLVQQRLPVVQGISIASTHEPATYIGGDFYGVIQKGKLLILYVSDITGHGLEGTMFSLFVKGCIESYIELVSESEISPDKVLGYLDQQVHKGEYPSEYAVAVFLMIINLATKELVFSAAGFQNPPVFVHTDTELLVCRGLPISPDLPTEVMDFERHVLQLPENAFIFMATDGIYEQHNGTELYEQRLFALLKQCNGLPKDTIADLVHNDFCDFRGEYEQSDDVAFLVLSTEKLEEHTLLSSFDSLVALREHVLAYYKERSEFPAIAMAVHELVANAIEHGNRFEQEKSVHILLSAKVVVVEDEGAGFNWRGWVERGLDLAINLERGRGIALVQMLAGDLVYSPTGNRVSLILRSQAGF